MIFHVMKSGTQISDISGHVVKIDQAAALYALMDAINEGKKRNYGDKGKTQKAEPVFAPEPDPVRTFYGA